jgi:hypothetical protein
MVSIAAQMVSSDLAQGGSCFAGFTATGVTAADGQSINFTYEGTSSSTGSLMQFGATYLVTTATAGSNTFTMVFKNGEAGATCTYRNMSIAVIPY